MKRYEEIDMYEKKIFKAKEQTAFLKGTLESIDVAIQLRKKKLDDDIAAYNLRAKREQEILEMYNKNILEWTKKLDKLVGKQIKSIEKEKVTIVVEKTEKELRKEQTIAKKRLLVEELKRAKEEIELLKASQELKKGNEAKVIKLPEPEPPPIEPEIDIADKETESELPEE